MKILMIEASAEELSANRRIADAICDAVSDALDVLVRGGIDFSDKEDEEDDEL